MKLAYLRIFQDTQARASSKAFGNENLRKLDYGLQCSLQFTRNTV